MIKIFHMADLHLDSPFSGGDLRRSENGRKRLRDVFRRMTKHIRENEYDIVLIAGDLYEGGFVTEETAEMIKSELGSLPCPVVISPGNHDPYCKGSLYASGAFPENVHIFKSEQIEKIDIDSLGVSVWGYAFTSSVCREDPLKNVITDSDRINILCAHTELDSPLSVYAPIKTSEIENALFTYAALGHVHVAPEPYISERCTAAYTGFAEGRAFDEIGEGGALSVSLFETGESCSVKLTRLSFSEYSFRILPVNVYGHISDNEIASTVAAAISEHGYAENTAVRVLLEGILSYDFVPNMSEIKRKCASCADYIEIKDNTLPTEDDASLSSDMTLRGEFYRLMKKKLDGDSDGSAAMALRIGLAALGGRDLSGFLPNDIEGTDENGTEA